MHLPRRCVDPPDRSRDDDLGAEPPRLLQRTTRQLVPRHTRREAEVVLDPRRGAGLPAGRLPLDHDRAQALRCAVHGGGQARGPGAHDHGVVLGGGGLGRQAEQLGHAAQLRSHHRLPVDDADRRAIAVGRHGAAPLLRGIRRVGREPLERDLVAVEEVAQLRADRVPAMPDHDRAWRRRLGCDALEPARSADPVGCEPADLLADVGVHGHHGVIVVRLDAHDARLLRRAKPDWEHGPECDRHLAEDVPGVALADDARDPIDGLDRLDATLEHGEERALAALVRRVLARRQGDVRRRSRKLLARRRAESGEDRERADLVRRHHDRNRLTDRTGRTLLGPDRSPY